ncbi:MAG: hypothetical protein IPI60_07835 [Saprospiraceae bacterium]|nr:hypothetical protein [Saprospiraceae bacterium]
MKSSLAGITYSLLNEEKSGIELLNLCRDLHSLFLEVSGFDPEIKESTANIKLNRGTAIGSTWAAMCILDFNRTQKFLKAINNAIKDKIDIQQNSSVQILYAGCGPFATLITPLLTLFREDQIKCTFIDINPVSIESLRNTLKAFDLESYIQKIELCDILEYQMNPLNSPDIVICETLQAGLRKEPQVAIYLHLGSQVKESTTFIPEKIEVHAGLLDSNLDYKRMMGELKDHESCIQILTPLLALEKSIYQSIDKHHHDSYIHFETKIFIPQELHGFDRICLLTKIKLYQDIELTYWESPLTIPVQLISLGPEQAGQVLKVHFELSSEPEFNLKFL